MHLKSVFTWVYCLDIPWVCILVIIGTVLLWILHARCKELRGWKIVLTVLLFLWLVSILWVTLISREGGCQQILELRLFQSYIDVFNGGNRELLRSNFMNVLLFYPAGLLLALLVPEKWTWWKAVLGIGGFALLLSAGIELCQYSMASGQVQTDDVFHNTVGAIVGALCAEGMGSWSVWLAGKEV